MKKYDIFKSQGGFGVALGIYLDSPVMGSIRWFETEPEAQEWRENKIRYDKDYAKTEEKVNSCGTMEEAEKIVFPKEKNYDLDKGVTI